MMKIAVAWVLGIAALAVGSCSSDGGGGGETCESATDFICAAACDCDGIECPVAFTDGTVFYYADFASCVIDMDDTYCVAEIPTDWDVCVDQIAAGGCIDEGDGSFSAEWAPACEGI